MLKLIKVIIAVPVVAVVAFVVFVYVTLEVREMLGITFPYQDFDTGLQYYRAGNDRMAALWYLKAARRGFSPAQSNLGPMYKYGWGVPKDYVKAYMWYDVAARNGSDLNAKWRDEVAVLMIPAQIAMAQRLASACFNSNYRDCE